MQCKDFERLIIDFPCRNLSRQEMEAIERHVARCSSCARFMEDLQRIRSSFETSACLDTPEKLLSRTRYLCYAEMEDMRLSGSSDIKRTKPIPTPKAIWAALFALVILTGILFTSLLPGFEMEETVSLKTALIVTLIVQNAAMLFFTPVLIQKLRLSMKRLEMNGYENFVP